MTIRVGTPADFDSLYETTKRESRGALKVLPAILRQALSDGRILVDDGSWSFVEFGVLKTKPQITIYNILVPQSLRGGGLGTRLLETLRDSYPDRFVLARCPTHLPSNNWYQQKGFALQEVLPPEKSRKVSLNVWVLNGRVQNGSS